MGREAGSVREVYKLRLDQIFEASSDSGMRLDPGPTYFLL